MHKLPSIWLTRPTSDSAHFAAALQPHGIHGIVAPVMTVGALLPPELAHAHLPDALLITSRHAAHALATLPESWRTLPVYCVGEATAEAVRAHGYAHVIAGDADAQAMVARMAGAMQAGSRVLYVCGDQTRVDVAALLAEHAIAVASYVTYHAVAETTLPRPLLEAINDSRLKAVTFFSPRSATIAAKLLSRAGMVEKLDQVNAYCLSVNVATAASSLPWKGIYSCTAPTQEAMLALIVSRHQQKVL